MDGIVTPGGISIVDKAGRHTGVRKRAIGMSPRGLTASRRLESLRSEERRRSFHH